MRLRRTRDVRVCVALDVNIVERKKCGCCLRWEKFVVMDLLDGDWMKRYVENIGLQKTRVVWRNFILNFEINLGLLMNNFK